MKLNRHKIRYKFSDDYSFLEVGGNVHNRVLVALVVIGLLAFCAFVLMFSIIIQNSFVILGLVLVLGFLVNYTHQKSQQGKNRFLVGPNKFEAHYEKNLYEFNNLSDEDLFIEFEEYNKYTALIVGHLKLANASLSNLTLLTIADEDPALILLNLEYIKNTIIEIYNMQADNKTS